MIPSMTTSPFRKQVLAMSKINHLSKTSFLHANRTWTHQRRPVVCFESKRACRILFLQWKKRTIVLLRGSIRRLTTLLCEVCPIRHSSPLKTIRTFNLPAKLQSTTRYNQLFQTTYNKAQIQLRWVVLMRVWEVLITSNWNSKHRRKLGLRASHSWNARLCPI